ncbi:MAG: PilN domain-containing protein [Pseudomonadota bacterium]
MSKLNFLERSAPVAGWRLLLLVAAVLACGAAGAYWIVQLRVLGKLETELAGAQPRRVEAAPMSAEAQRLQDQQMKVAAVAVRQLNLPVARLIKTLQAPPDIHAALLGLDLNGRFDADAASGPVGAGAGASAAAGSAGAASSAPAGPAGVLKISAQAQTAQDMMNYVAFLSEQPLFSAVYLVKHEQNAVGERAYRFELEAQWKD